MAVSELVRSQLRLTYIVGTDEMTGRSVYKYKSFNNVKTSADANQLLVIANALTGLQKFPLYTIERNDNSEISVA